MNFPLHALRLAIVMAAATASRSGKPGVLRVDDEQEQQHGRRAKASAKSSKCLANREFCGDDAEACCSGFCDSTCYEEMRNRRLRTTPTQHKAPPPLPDFYTFNPVLDDHDWMNFNLNSFRDALQCSAIVNENRPIHDASTWAELRSVYEDVVGSERSSITSASRNLDADKRSFMRPSSVDVSTLLQVKEIPGKGRGLVASRDIEKGEHLWSDVYLGEFLQKVNNLALLPGYNQALPSRYRAATFHKRADLNRFLAVLPTELACDVILWTYQSDDEGDDFYYSVHLDLGTFCNHGGAEGTNIEWIHGDVVDTAIASRKIAAGEEILCNYNQDNFPAAACGVAFFYLLSGSRLSLLHGWVSKDFKSNPEIAPTCTTRQPIPVEARGGAPKPHKNKHQQNPAIPCYVMPQKKTKKTKLSPAATSEKKDRKRLRERAERACQAKKREDPDVRDKENFQKRARRIQAPGYRDSATEMDVKAAYRMLALRFHPQTRTTNPEQTGIMTRDQATSHFNISSL
ncbi:hypothetical protein THAOC_35822 [Thalassiosira oceanica]|uniref:SET domain-containing protein n=1 Tax=Thalassiosira oceanica TaxID=159749 RepID=K0R2T6_THAOC|nr:hypothetical protein THAOC_35822 [Thalassiosira oceanica]|eukprot:EJK45559.1 hypothetical protein THAOC_35822 [Thalassiosira oceanica]